MTQLRCELCYNTEMFYPSFGRIGSLPIFNRQKPTFFGITPIKTFAKNSFKIKKPQHVVL